MSKRKTKILLATIMMLCLVISGLSVSAADNRIGEMVDGSVLTDNRKQSMVMIQEPEVPIWLLGQVQLRIWEADRYAYLEAQTVTDSAMR